MIRREKNINRRVFTESNLDFLFMQEVIMKVRISIMRIKLKIYHHKSLLSQVKMR